MKATKVMIKNEFDRRVELLEQKVQLLKSNHHRYFDKYDDHAVWTRLLTNAFSQIDKGLDDLKELAKEWDEADS